MSGTRMKRVILLICSLILTIDSAPSPLGSHYNDCITNGKMKMSFEHNLEEENLTCSSCPSRVMNMNFWYTFRWKTLSNQWWQTFTRLVDWNEPHHAIEWEVNFIAFAQEIRSLKTKIQIYSHLFKWDFNWCCFDALQKQTTHNGLSFARQKSTFRRHDLALRTWQELWE